MKKLDYNQLTKGVDWKALAKELEDYAESNETRFFIQKNYITGEVRYFSLNYSWSHETNYFEDLGDWITISVLCLPCPKNKVLEELITWKNNFLRTREEFLEYELMTEEDN